MAPPGYFMFSPEPITESDFQWRGKFFHLTYSTFISLEDMLRTVRRATSTPWLGYSLVHEQTEKMDDDGTQLTVYPHTHFAVMFKVPICLRGCRKFDVYSGVDEYHPNVQKKINVLSMEQLFIWYHQGHKKNIETGAWSYSPPIALTQVLPPDFEWTEQIILEVTGAPNLVAACVAGQVRPRSVSDVKALREDTSGAIKRFEHLFPRESFTLTPPPTWVCLWVSGPSGMGKTKWCLSLTDNPCPIKPCDSIGCMEALSRKFNPRFHDCIVFDEADLRFLTRQQVIGLIDSDEDFEMDVRFKSFTIPKGTRKIFISNPPWREVTPNDPFGAIARRLHVVEITQPTFKPPPALPPQPPAAASPATQVVVARVVARAAAAAAPAAGPPAP